MWDYDLDQHQFRQILEGRLSIGRLDQDWAIRRLLEYASYEEIIPSMGYKEPVKNGPQWCRWIRSKSRLRGFDFFDEVESCIAKLLAFFLLTWDGSCVPFKKKIGNPFAGSTLRLQKLLFRS